jgi:hypothetical protein
MDEATERLVRQLVAAREAARLAEAARAANRARLVAVEAVHDRACAGLASAYSFPGRARADRVAAVAEAEGTLAMLREASAEDIGRSRAERLGATAAEALRPALAAAAARLAALAAGAPRVLAGLPLALLADTGPDRALLAALRLSGPGGAAWGLGAGGAVVGPGRPGAAAGTVLASPDGARAAVVLRPGAALPAAETAAIDRWLMAGELPESARQP